MTTTEWGTGHEPDPEELVDFMTEEGCGPVRMPHIEPHPVPLHAPEEGLLDEEGGKLILLEAQPYILRRRIAD